MLPATAKMFALVRDLSSRREVTEIPVSRWLLERHHLGPLTALAGAPGLRDQLARATVRWAALARELPSLVAQLRAAGVGCAPIKGVAYATSLYDTPAARPMTDVDLLLEPGTEARAHTALAAAGFRKLVDIRAHHASTWLRGDLTLDVHRNILGAGRSRIALDAVWARTLAGWPAGARRLEPVDELVFHLAHMARNRLCGPLVQVVDAARLLERADARAVRARAHDWQIGAMVGAALAFCEAILAGEPLRSRLAPRETEILFALQPPLARKLLFDVATAGSPRQLAARAIGAGFQWLAR